MDSFPITSLPYHLQQEVIKKLKPRTALRLQRTCHWGLESVDGCKQFAVLRENRKKFGSRWTGDDNLEIGFLVEVQKESRRCKSEEGLEENLEKILSTWEKIFEKSRYTMRISSGSRAFLPIFV